MMKTLNVAQIKRARQLLSASQRELKNLSDDLASGNYNEYVVAKQLAYANEYRQMVEDLLFPKEEK